MKKRVLIVFFLLACTALYAGVKPSLPDAAQLQLMLKKLTVVGGALYVGAHPDDENTALLAYWSQGRLVRSAYLSLTRGEGGQNLIGPEQGAMLGLIRTQELLAAREIDHAQQFFTRAVDFGYSKSADESLKMWGRDNILSDVVWVIRKFRPDVIVCRFPTDGRGGHGHHTASSLLAQEAFAAAGDPARFPEQLKNVAPWKPKRILWNYFNWTGPPPEKDAATMVKTDIGGYSPLLGLSYTELAGMSRSMHKSQGFGDSEDRGPAPNYFQLIAGEPAKADLFESIDLTWKRIPGSEKIAAALEEANSKFDPENPEASVPPLLRAYHLMQSFPSNVWVEEKKKDVLAAIAACSGLWLEAITSSDSATPGGEIKVTMTAINRSSAALILESARLEAEISMNSATGDFTLGTALNLPVNQPVSRESTYRIPDSMPISQPYWIQESRAFRIDDVTEQNLIGLPESEPGLRARFGLSLDGEKLWFEVPVLFRRVDPVRGELYSHFEIIPDVAVNLTDRVFVFAGKDAKRIGVTLTSGEPGISGEVKLNVPSGWRIDPPTQPFQFAAKGETKAVVFSVAPEERARSGVLTAEVIIGSKHFSQGIIKVDYPHISTQTAFPPAEGKLVKLDLKKSGENIAYIMGSGDSVPDALQQIGYHITLLGADDLAAGDLSKFDAIVVGIRAYNTRSDLKAARSRLLDYVKQGGTVVVQYNTLLELDQNGLGPYPFRVSRDRVSMEDSPVTILSPDHQLLNFPNRITQDDFSGWIQERGLYFPDQWDSQYETVIACNDPGEAPKTSGILFARYGKGVYIYTGYSWFRQLPAGVPGAVRLFVNLISAGKAPQQ